MHNVIIRTLTLAALAGAALFGTPAQAQWNGSGSQMKVAFPSDNGCLRADVSYGGIVNNCGYWVWAKATLPVTQGYWNTTVSVWGNNTQCVVASINDDGTGAFTTSNWTLAGSQRWQTVNTGLLGVWNWTPVVFACNLEPGGKVGRFAAYY
jgi:hypothetical protein